jgi:hypothetical protein
MKTIGRIVIILTAFVIVMGIVYIAVDASGSSSSSMVQFDADERLAPPDGQFEGRPEHLEGGGGWMFGLVKNVGVIAVVTMLIVVPRNIRQKRRHSVPAPAK